jgi:hypothetical protein
MLPIELLPLMAILVPGAPVASETTSQSRNRSAPRAAGGFRSRAPPAARAFADPGQSPPDPRPTTVDSLDKCPSPTESLSTPQRPAAENVTNVPGEKGEKSAPPQGAQTPVATRVRIDKARSRDGYRRRAAKQARRARSHDSNADATAATTLTSAGRLRPLAEQSRGRHPPAPGRLRSVGEWTRAVAQAAADHEVTAAAVHAETAASLGEEGAPAVQQPALAEIPFKPRRPHTRVHTPPTSRGASPTPACALPGVPKETCPVAVVERKRAPYRMVPTLVIAHASLVEKPGVPCRAVQVGGGLDMPGLDAGRAWLERGVG